MDNCGIGRPLFTVLNLSYSGLTENRLSNNYLLNIFSAIYISLNAL